LRSEPPTNIKVYGESTTFINYNNNFFLKIVTDFIFTGQNGQYCSVVPINIDNNQVDDDNDNDDDDDNGDDDDDDDDVAANNNDADDDDKNIDTS
jgi:hypothetical protein